MIVVVIVGAMILGWFFGNVLLNKWTNDGIDELDKQIKKNKNGESTKRPPKTKK